MRLFFFLGCLFIVSGGLSQEITVLDADSRQPIVNAVLYNSNKSRTALTDFDGVCDLSKFNGTERITISHIGYQARSVTKNQLLKRGKRIFLMPQTEQLDEVVMSISKWEQQKKDIPQKISSISAQTIAFTNPQTAADLLQNSGQVFVQKSQLGGGSPMIRGFATNRLVLSVDGVRMNNAIFRGGNIQNVISIDPFTIKNTEVIFGPGSVIYGSDAIGGVMNFLTLQPNFILRDSVVISGNINGRYASANTENTYHADINIASEKWAFLSSVTYNNFDDLKMGSHGPDRYLRNTLVNRQNDTDVLVINENPRKQVPTAYDQINLLQKISYKPSNNWQYDLGLYFSETSSYSRYDRLIRPNSDESGLQSAEWYYGPQKWFMGNLQIFNNARSKFYDGVKLTTAYQFFEESRNDRDFQDPILNKTKENVDVFSANIDFENKRMGNLRLYYGGEYIYNKVNSVGSQENIETGSQTSAASRYPDNSSWQTLAGYVNAEYKAKPNLTLLSGIRYSHVWIDAVFDTTYYPFPFDEANLNNGALTGSLGLSWFPNQSLQFTLNGSTGFRAPNIDDIGKVFDSEPGSVVVPNPQLEPEYAYNIEAGIKKNFKDKAVIRAAAFYTYLVDALVRRDFTFNGESEILYNGELSNVQAIQNAAKAYVYGFEFGAEVFLTNELQLTTNLTITEGIEEDDSGEESAARHAAPTFGDLHLIWILPRLKTDLFLNYNGEISYDNLALTERSKDYLYDLNANGDPYAPSWYTLNLRSQFKLSEKLTSSLTLENITDQRYRSYSSGIAAPGTNLILGLGYKF
ncbi:TonB-dependent receptor [uncultured Muriicola sp.]|uniref:TonB-dependent receptor n=1 Tax=uncultured Muriicola sp. TaxID=1583102 RepID=UPI0026083886|nr:TonB-dependent receptor [uncultured Muriicola sp.]